MVKNLPANAEDAGDTGSIPGSGRSPGGRNGNLLQHSRLGNPMDRGARWATVQVVVTSRTWLSMHNQGRPQTSAIFKEMGIADHLASLLRSLYADQEADVEQQTGSKLRKKYIKAVYCHPAYLTYMQSTSCQMPGWMKHKLESRLPEEISATSDM